jgi:hypothetical protein
MNLQSILKTKYPQGSHGGECASWCEQIFSFGPVGDTLASKTKFVKSNGDCYLAGSISELAKGFRIGDVVFTSESPVHGHVAIITGFDKDSLILAESNFSLDKKVNYGRRLPMLSSKIIGIGRFPFKIDLGFLTIPFSYDVFLNNQDWSLKVLESVKSLISQYTKLDVTFFAAKTTFQNWWYEDFPFNGSIYRVIAKSFLVNNVVPYSFTNYNAASDLIAFIVSPAQWQGTVYGNQQGAEIAWTSNDIKVVQGSCGEMSKSPWYDMPLITHILIHELSHYLHYLAGSKSDQTDIIDNQKKDLKGIFKDLDWNRIAVNL